MPTEINGYSPSEETALSSLIINEVDSNETFEKMKEKGILQDNQLYLVTDEQEGGTYYTAGEVDALLANKAPAGYGLGVGPKMLTSDDDLNNIWNPGYYIYHSSSIPKNAPALQGLIADVLFLNVSGVGNSYFIQEVTPVTNGTGSTAALNNKIVRSAYDVIRPWEWVNPPMALGVEYRTTERFLGKPVYVKAVSIDGLPNNGIKTFPWSDSYTNIPFFVTGQAMRSNGGSYMSLPTNVYYSLSGSPMNGMVSISAIEKQIAIKTDFDATSFDTVTVCVKYTKTTD